MKRKPKTFFVVRSEEYQDTDHASLKDARAEVKDIRTAGFGAEILECKVVEPYE